MKAEQDLDHVVAVFEADVAKMRAKGFACRGLEALHRAQTADARRRIAWAIAVTHPWARLLMAKSQRERLDRPLPAYPYVHGAWQARLILGESPAQITGLPPKLAHMALADGQNSERDVCFWLLRHFHAPLVSLYSVPVALWLVERAKDPAQLEALTRERTERGPHGEEIRGRLLDRLDELRPEDLRPSVRETFERAGQRLLKAMLRQKAHEPLAPMPAWWSPMRAVRVLQTKAELAAEGKAMSHCVGTYVAYVKGGRSVILSVRVVDKEKRVHRSTAEIDRRTMDVRQHRGHGNGPAPELCAKALAVWMKRLGRKV